MLRVSRAAGLAMLLALGVALSGCGSASGSVPAAKLVPRVQAATDRAQSVHIAGSVTQGSKTTTIDASFDGTLVAGTLGTSGTSFYVLSLSNASYVKLSASFLKLENAPASLCARICGKYVELSGASSIEITEFLSMQELVQEVFNSKNMRAAASSGCTFAPATHNDQTVLQCSQGGYTLDVAAHGQPYLVYWSGPNGQHLAFSDWNSVTLPGAPAPSQVVSISDLS